MFDAASQLDLVRRLHALQGDRPSAYGDLYHHHPAQATAVARAAEAAVGEFHPQGEQAIALEAERMAASPELIDKAMREFPAIPTRWRAVPAAAQQEAALLRRMETPAYDALRFVQQRAVRHAVFARHKIETLTHGIGRFAQALEEIASDPDKLKQATATYEHFMRNQAQRVNLSR